MVMKSGGIYTTTGTLNKCRSTKSAYRVNAMITSWIITIKQLKASLVCCIYWRMC